MAKTATRRTHDTVFVTVDAEIDADTLENAGWHHEDDCPLKREPPPAGTSDVGHAARTFHDLAGHLLDVAACGQEPCRSLPLDAVLTTMSAR